MPPETFQLLQVPRDPTRDAETQVRDWLAALTHVPTAEVQLARDARGRPRLHGALADADVNWSHSGEYLLAAFGSNVDLGVDLESREKVRDVAAIAERYFSATEQDWLLRLEGSERDAHFLRLWCAKEALLKAVGVGLSFGLDRLSFAQDQDGALRLQSCDPALGDAADWSLELWTPMPGATAALAWRSRASHR